MRIYKNMPVSIENSENFLCEKELSNPEILHINRLAPRATVIPAQKEGVYYRNKEESSLVYDLNGEYRFALFSHTAPEGFMMEDFDDSDWDVESVPSMWQYNGYSQPSYPNVQYPFPFNPPKINVLNPVGCYRRTFSLSKEQSKKKNILHFEGVDNAFYVYLNGSAVGFSKGSRLPSEFDITELVREGENLLAVKVYTYSDASYLENQDMLLASGIFRDVYILQTEHLSVWDYAISSDRKGFRCAVELSAPCENAYIKYSVNGQSEIKQCRCGASEFEFTPESPIEWNAEMPYLYDFSFALFEGERLLEQHSKRVGLVTSKVSGRQVLINDSPIYIKGINRHENNCSSGRAISAAQILSELKEIKSANLNAIRCSHYTNHAAFYEYASELGIYVMDEADIETHGCEVVGDQGFLNKDIRWQAAFLDRVKRMVAKNKNETCINIWSIGNEAGRGQNTEACAKFLRALPNPKPVNYSQDSDELGTNEFCDFYGCGYPDIAFMEEHDKAPDNRPIILTEYSHAMGNSPGNLEDIWDYIYSHPSFAGGYAWEYKSHGLLSFDAEGREFYKYGGDFNDYYHWTNFTLDGFHTSDGTPKPTYNELKAVSAPVRCSWEGGSLEVFNTYDFLDLADVILNWEIIENFTPIRGGSFDMPPIKPHSRGSLELDLGVKAFNSYSDYRLNLRFLRGEQEIAFCQLTVKEKTESRPFIPEKAELMLSGDKANLEIKGRKFTVGFKSGMPCFYEKNGSILFDSPMKFCLMRAGTDNDGIIGLREERIGEWNNHGLPYMFFTAENIEYSNEGSVFKMKTVGKLMSLRAYSGFDAEICFNLYSNGLLAAEINAAPFGNQSSVLPRFGIALETEKEMSRVNWYGRGPSQNYSDCLLAAPFGYYTKSVEKMNFLFDVPQETGNRGDVNFVRLYNPAEKIGLCVYAADRMQFSVHPWKLENLIEARHKNELFEDDKNHLYIDYLMRPLGSHSCGPEPETKYDFFPHSFRFAFALNGEAPAEEYPEFFGCDFGVKTQKLTDSYTPPVYEEERNSFECK